MNPASSRLRAVFCAAAEIEDPARRASFLDSECADDPALRARVERLLAAESQAGGFLRDCGERPGFDPFPEKIGQRIGRYRIVERLGQGGCGVVYLAEQEQPVRRQVALKVIKLGMDTGAVVARFENERQAIALMDHPNIARVFDAGATETGRPFFVMELVSGLPITEYCRRHSLSVRRRLDIFIQVCHAVQHAHQKGIIHRDLKPSNILVAEHDGGPVPKVIDFGIAKATEMAGGQTVTSANEFVGTPAYMSPEQVTAGRRDIDTRSDIYGLGVILYELMTGHPPFEMKDVTAAGIEEMRRLIREIEPPRPSTRLHRSTVAASRQSAADQPGPNGGALTRRRYAEEAAALRGDLDWIVMKCLEKDRTRRYETANALAMDLRRHLEHEPVNARPPSGLYRLRKVVRRHRVWFAAAAVIGLVLLAAAVVSTHLALRATRAERVAQTKATESEERLVRRFVAEGNRLVEQKRPLAALPWLIEALQLEKSPARIADGRLRIAQAMDDAPKLQLHLTQGDWIDSVALSANGKLLATGSDNGVVRISDVTSGGEWFTNLSLRAEAVRTVQFSPDGKRLVAVDRDGWTAMWNASTGEPLLPLFRAPDYEPSVVKRLAARLYPTARFSPDGELLLLAWGSRSAQLRDAFTGELRRELTHSAVVWHAAFSKDGALVVTSADDGEVRVWETSTGKLAAPPLRHSKYVAWSELSPDTKLVLAACDRRTVRIWNWRTGTPVGPEVAAPKVLFAASFSPDGKKFLTASWIGVVRLHEVESGQLLAEFHHEGGVVDAAFSPDGRHIAVAAHDDNVWIWNVTDARVPAAVLPLGDLADRVVFSAKGNHIAVGGRSGRARVWELFPPKASLRRFATRDGRWVEFDPSTRHIVVAGGSRDGDARIYDATTRRRLGQATFAGESAGRARFSPDGARLLLAAGRTARVLNATNAENVLPPLTHRSVVSDALWSPDGSSMVTAAPDDGVQLWSARTGELTARFPESKGVREVALSPDGKHLATAHNDRTVRLWEVSSQRRLFEPWHAPYAIRKIAFAPHGRHFAFSTASADGESEVQVREVATGAQVVRILHRNELNDFEYSRDGRYMVTASEERTARVWDAVTGEAVSPWLIHTYAIQRANFSPDSTRLVTLGTRGFVRLWSARTGEPLTTFFDFTRDDGDYRAQFAPDGQRLLFTTGAQSAWILDLIPERASLDELKLRARVLSCTRVDPVGGVAPLDNESLNDAWKRLRALQTPR